MGDATSNTHYPNAMSSLSRQMRRPGIQRGVFSFAQTSPRDLVRSKLSTSEISHRALTYLSDDLLQNIPKDTNTYSLFQGFKATLPENESEHRKAHRRRTSRSQRLLADASNTPDGPPALEDLKKERNAMNHRLEMMAIRKNLCSTEIHEIDNKISNLNSMRKIVLDRLADLENDEAQLEHECKLRGSKVGLVTYLYASLGAGTEIGDCTRRPWRRGSTRSVCHCDISLERQHTRASGNGCVVHVRVHLWKASACIPEAKTTKVQ